MKNIYLLFVVLLLPMVVFSQSDSEPTVREIYDFAVGDTFEYFSDATYYWPPQSGTWNYQMETFFYRRNYGNDSIVYGFKSVEFDTSSSSSNGGKLNTNVTIDTVFFTITLLDSSIYYYYYSDTFVTLDSTVILIESGDSIYEEWDHYYSNLCPGEDGNITTLSQNSSQYEAGLGEINSEGTIQCESGYSKLIFYHKASGQQFGIPHDFITGIKEIASNCSIQLFPNPASNNFQLQFSSQPPDKTYLQIFNGLGQQVIEREISSSLTSVNRGKLSNGIYFWQVLQDGEILQRGKLILQ